MAILPIPTVPFFDPVTKAVAIQWQNFFNSIETALPTTLAPIDARYVTTTANTTLSNDVNLGLLADGLLKVVVAAGIATISSLAFPGGTTSFLRADGTFAAPTGVTPAAHAASHQNGGADELSVAGLSGLLADGQTPLAHKTAHQSGGSDAIKLDDLAAPTDVTTLNATTSAHGLLRKGSNVATEFLNGQLNWATPAASGKVVQIVTATYGTATASSSSTYADTGLTATITPTSASNKVLVVVHQAGIGKEANNTYVALGLLRGATFLAVFESQACYTNSTATNFAAGAGCVYLDSPATTAATTYKTQLKSGAGTTWVYAQVNSSVSTIALLEVTP